MKLASLFFTLALFFTISALGQTKFKSDATRSLGISGYGILNSLYEVPDGFSQDTRTGWGAGGYYNERIKNFTFIAEILAVQKEFSFSYAYGDLTTAYKFEGGLVIHRLILNLQFLYTPRFNTIGRIIVGAGPYFGYGISARRSQTETIISGGITQTYSSEGNLGFGENRAQRTEFGIHGKLGIAIHERLMIHTGYAINARRIFNGSQEYRSHSFHLGLGYNLIRFTH